MTCGQANWTEIDNAKWMEYEKLGTAIESYILAFLIFVFSFHSMVLMLHGLYIDLCHGCLVHFRMFRCIGLN